MDLEFYKEISCDIIDSHHFLHAAIRYGHVTILRQLQYRIFTKTWKLVWLLLNLWIQK